MVTGSGELFDVSVVEYGEEVARAEYVRIDATEIWARPTGL